LPHHVAATGALLSEVTFGFALMAGLYALAIAMDRRRHGVLILAAACFGYAYLVNPLIALFPPAIALLVWREKGRQAALLFVGVFLLPVLALGLRNVQLDTSATQASRVGRAAINMVQGSWPQYHHAWQAQLQGDPGGIAIMQKINKEASLLDAHPAAGFAALTGRLRTAPGYYAAWYLWQKPALLWSWDIQIGPGGVYVLDVSHSPLDTHPLLRESTKLLRILNPLLTLVAFAGALLLLVGALRRVSWAPAAALATAALAFYLTAVHTVFQAEPRYANAYRGIETVLIVTFLQLLAGAWRQWQSRKQAFEPLAK